MSPIHTLLLILVLLCIAAAIYGFLYSEHLLVINPFLDKKILERGMDKPVIWLYYDDSDVNSRQWYDFGARSSRALNIPFLNLCYESIVKQNKNEYRIEVIGGLTGAAELLGGWDQLPTGLRDPKAPVNEAEMNYLRVAILAKFGGLWLSPYSVSLRGFGVLPKDKVIFFGTDLDETYAGSAGTNVPGFRALWSPKPNHPMFKEWAAVTYQRVAEKRGGAQIRGDAKWDFIRFSTEERLNEIMQIHRDHGVQINNPHVYTLEDGKAGNKLNPDVLRLKDQLDPQGLLNPGKLRTWSKPSKEATR